MSYCLFGGVCAVFGWIGGCDWRLSDVIALKNICCAIVGVGAATVIIISALTFVSIVYAALFWGFRWHVFFLYIQLKPHYAALI